MTVVVVVVVVEEVGTSSALSEALCGTARVVTAAAAAWALARSNITFHSPCEKCTRVYNPLRPPHINSSIHSTLSPLYTPHSSVQFTHTHSESGGQT